MHRVLLLLFIGLMAALSVQIPLAAAQSKASLTAVASIKGPIGPATSAYISKSLQSAHEMGAQAVVLEIDTPGGLSEAMRDIVQAILISPIPVISYVTPEGARAASAGTYILYASHYAAMAPATNLGAATPVAIGGSSPAEKGFDKAKEETGLKDAAETKAVNDAVAYIRSLAERRGRNADWAEKAVRSGASISADTALKTAVIDAIAADRAELLQGLHGKTFTLGDSAITLATQPTQIDVIEPDWRDRLLSIITNPTIAYGLMLIGIYGLLLEGYSPGALVPGVVGVISLILALYAFQLLPVNYAGLGLMIVGVIFIALEFAAPSFGALGIGGLIAFLAGSIILMDASVPGYSVNRGAIAGLAIAGSGIMIGTLYLVGRSRKHAIVTGQSALIGATGSVMRNSNWAMISGERWQICCDHPLNHKDRVQVVAIDGLKLTVTKLEHSTDD